MKTILLLLFSLLVQSGWAASPSPGSLFTYEGILTDTAGNPLSGSTQTVTFQILHGTCVLFEETHTLNIGDVGEFSVTVGSGARQDNTGNTGPRIFGVGGSANCEGSSPVTFAGFTGRTLHIKVGSVDLSPDILIGNIPMAINAQRLEDKAAADFLQVNEATGTNQANLQALLTQFTDLNNLLAAYQGNTLNAQSAQSAVTFTNPLNGDLSGGQTTTRVERLQGQTLSLGTASTGQVIKYDGTKWVNSTVSDGVLSVSASAPLLVTGTSTAPQIGISDATSLAKGVVKVGVGLSVTSGTVTVDPANFPSLVPVTKGGTGVSALTSDQLLKANASGTGLSAFTCPAGQVVGFDVSGAPVCADNLFANGGNFFGGTARLGTNDSGSLELVTNNIVAMTIDGLSRVLVGAGTATHLLTVSGGASATPMSVNSNATSYTALHLNNASSSAKWNLAVSGSSGGTAGPPGTFSLLDVSVGASRLSVDVQGNVGIGGTVPQAKLDVNGDIRLRRNTAAPATCTTAIAGTIALNSSYMTCVCNGSSWVRTSDGITNCAW